MPETPSGLVQVSIELRWRRVGELTLDEAGRIVLPALAEEPALYRLRVARDEDGRSLLIGEAPNIARRIAGLASLSATGPMARAQAMLLAELSNGHRVALDIVTSDRTVRIAGRAHPVDLADRAARRLLEQAARIAEEDLVEEPELD